MPLIVLSAACLLASYRFLASFPFIASLAFFLYLIASESKIIFTFKISTLVEKCYIHNDDLNFLSAVGGVRCAGEGHDGL